MAFTKDIRIKCLIKKENERESRLEEKNKILTSRNINNLEVSNFYSYKLNNLLKKLLIKLNFKK